MSYARMLYETDVLELLGKAEAVLLEDKNLEVKTKTVLQEFVYEMERHIKSDLNVVVVRDLKRLPEKQPYFTGTVS